jgi:hypothetical protein
MRINDELLWSKKLGLTTVGDPPCRPCDTPLSAKVGTKFRQQVAVAQSVYFACVLKATEFVFLHAWSKGGCSGLTARTYVRRDP